VAFGLAWMSQENGTPRLARICAPPPVVLASLFTLLVASFVLVTRLVDRFHEQEKALARHLFASGQSDQNAGQLRRAIQEFRAALSYDRSNFQYQLSLARALRESGGTGEAESYLLNLWERSPQDGSVNLALGRLYAREGVLDKAIQYYHKAIYGEWPDDSDSRRRDARFELIEFLLRQKAFAQTQAELIAATPSLPRDSALQLRLADLFNQAQDYEHALSQYEEVLHLDPGNAAALAGAGKAAFQLARYRTAETYLRRAAAAEPHDAQSSQWLEASTLVLRSNPFAPGLSNSERMRRLRMAFNQAGARLSACAQDRGLDLNPQSPPVGLSSLNSQWQQMKPKLDTARAASQPDIQDAAMDLVFAIEQQTRAICGTPGGLDQALLLLMQDLGRTDKRMAKYHRVRGCSPTRSYAASILLAELQQHSRGAFLFSAGNLHRTFLRACGRVFSSRHRLDPSLAVRTASGAA
jgi:tetratricopeptide (TPR) repeat protein